MKRKFKVGDRVTVHDETSLFHTRTQGYARGHTGVVVADRPEWVIPEDEAWGRLDNGRIADGGQGMADPAFKQRLLADGTKASQEVGIDWRDPDDRADGP